MKAFLQSLIRRPIAGSLVVVCFTAAALPGADTPLDPIGPNPMRDPVVPDPGSGSSLSAEERLLRDIDLRIRNLDGRIRSVEVRYPAGLPLIDTSYLSGLETLRDQRDSAWLHLEEVLALDPDGLTRDRPDVLDHPPGPKRERDMDRFRAQALLGIAECEREIYLSSLGVQGDLNAGGTALGRLNPNALEPIDQPRFHFLRIWFGVEQTRLAKDDEERMQALDQARASLAQLRGTHPDSVSLISQAEQLIGGIDLDDAIERARAGAGGQ